MLGRNDAGNVNLYEVLGVDRVATQDEIRKTYKTLAMKYHPDKNPTGGERFKEICAAYRILSDPEQRMQYDQNKKKVSLKDLQVELTQQELKEFVDDLMRSDRDEAFKRRDFEKRREEEMRRRAEFESAHPNFKMASYTYKDAMEKVPAGSSSAAYSQAQKSEAASAYADFRSQGLGRDTFFKGGSPDPGSARSNGPDLSGLSGLGLGASGSSYKQQQLNAFRERVGGHAAPPVPPPRVVGGLSGRSSATTAAGGVGGTSGVQTTTTAGPSVIPSPRYTKGVASASFPLGPDGVPLPDTEVLKKAYEKFDYEEFMHKTPVRLNPQQKEKLGDAILADALRDYNFEDTLKTSRFT